MAKVSYTAEEAGAHIIREGYSWGFVQGEPVQVSYAFRLNEPTYNNSSNVYGTFSQFNAVQVAAATTALQLWSDVADITFVPEGSGSAPSGDSAAILFANYWANDGAAAFAYLPSPSRMDGDDPQGDVWVNRYYGQTNPVEGGYSYMALIHEIGHAIGLGHPGDYDAWDGQPVTYSNSAEYLQDSRQYTVMSYFGAGSTGADHGGYYASTPLMHDIVALQMLYGANYDTRAGDSVYGFNANAGASFSLGSANEKLIFSIWDGGGEDTLDFSGYSNNQIIDLRDGSFSSVGGLTDNVSIAPGAVIENAIGGSGNDRLTGNGADNTIHGERGHDVVYGGGGNDVLSGSYAHDGLYGQTGNDRLFGENGNDRLGGGQGDDYVSGGPGADTLFGAVGNDTLIGGGGADRMVGGPGADVFSFAAVTDSVAGNTRDYIDDFERGIDLIDLSGIDANVLIGGDQAFTWVGGAAFSGTAGELRYRPFSGTDVVVQADVDGDGKQDIAIQLKKLSALDSDDFVL